MDKITWQMSHLTPREKIALCSGKNYWQTKSLRRLGIPSLFLADGPHGLRKQEARTGVDMLGVHRAHPATCFPTAVTLAGSWDTRLLARVGAAIAAEAAAHGVGLVLGPGVNIKRDPLCGRNFEYFSEDPVLAGTLAAAYIQGMQKNGIGACVKHFAANSQETSRFTSDSVVDARTLRELYLAPFEMAVCAAHPAAVMCAYNKLNGIHCSDHRWLLTDVLRREWGFGGLVVTDWGALCSRTRAFAAGCDLAMPGGSGYGEKEALQALCTGALDAACVDASVRRVLTLAHSARRVKAVPFDKDAHHALACRAAKAGAVLLQNGGALPLKQGTALAVIGAMAVNPRYQGSGSSHISPTRVTCALDFLPGAVYAAGCTDDGATNEALLAEAVAAARAAHTAVVFAGLPDACESEGFDRSTLDLPDGHRRMIEAVAAVNPNTVVVLLCGGVVACPWAEKVNAVLYMGLPGQAGGEAAAALLYGRVNPSGKLAETWPLRYADCPTAGCYRGRRDAEYREGLYVGYRYYDKARQPVRWPFGHGLSYTSFAYRALTVQSSAAYVTVENTGRTAGAEVVQVYIEPPAGGLHRPVRELKGFAKVFLQPGERATVTVPLPERAFAVWADGWKTPGGVYTVRAGGSSRDLPLAASVTRQGEPVPAPVWQAGSWYEHPHGTPTRSQWQPLLGARPLPPLHRPEAAFTMDSTPLEMRRTSRLMRLLCVAALDVAAHGTGTRDLCDPTYRMMLAASLASPLRSMQIATGLPDALFKTLLASANRRAARGAAPWNPTAFPTRQEPLLRSGCSLGRACGRSEKAGETFIGPSNCI